jgi:uncharacterized repeat protein (TIGR01451 family)
MRAYILLILTLFAIFFGASGLQANCDVSSEGYVLDWANGTNPNGRLFFSEVVSRKGTSLGDAHSEPVTVRVDFTGDTGSLVNSRGTYPRFSTNMTGNTPGPLTALMTGVDHNYSGQYVNYILRFSQPVYNFKTTVLDVDTRTPRSNGTRGFQDEISVFSDSPGSPFNVALSSIHVPNPPGVVYPGTVHIGAPLPNYRVAARQRQIPGGGLSGLSSSYQNWGNVDINIAGPLNWVLIQFRAGTNWGFSTTNPQFQIVGISELNFCRPKLPNLSFNKTVKLQNETGIACNFIPGIHDLAARAMIPGACIEYNISVQNSGSGAATGVNISDVLEPNLVFMEAVHSGFSVTPTPGSGFTKPALGTDCGLTSCEIKIEGGSIPSDGSGLITIRALLK